jgi:hypothetical protein
MPNKTILRILIACHIFLVIASIVVDEVFKSALPPVLRDYEASQLHGEAPLSLVLLTGYVFLLLGALVVSWIGLLNFWGPARVFFLLATVIGILITPFIGPIIHSGTSFACGDAGSVLAGVILTLVYLSPFKDLYDKAHRPGFQ